MFDMVGPRLPERITIAADTIAAFLFVNAFEGELQIPLTGRMGGVLGCLFLAMMTFHLAGERDTSSNSWRRRTLYLGIGWVTATVAGWLGGAAFPQFPFSSMRPAMTALGLVAIILITHYGFRSSDLRPIAAGLRRGGGWLLGMSVAKAATVAFSEFEFSPEAAMAWAWKTQTFVGFTRAEWLVAASVGLYMAGVLWLREHTIPENTPKFAVPSTSRVSTDTSNPPIHPSSPPASPRIAGMRTELIAGMSATLAGILLLIPLPKWAVGIDALFLSDPARWSILTGALAMLAFLRNYRVLKIPYRALRKSDQILAQGVVRQGILAVIFLDAAICVTTAGVTGAVWVLLLVVPATMADRWIGRMRPEQNSVYS